MNLSKSFDFFDPNTCKERIHIIGCGSVGSTVAELLARFGLTKFSLYDFDYVEPKNIVNQMFTNKHVGMDKVDALESILLDINPEIVCKKHKEGWKNQPLDGYVFLCVDNIEVRKEIVKSNMYNGYVKAIFDFRTGLTDGQHYAADWSSREMRNNLLATMNFTHSEAKENTPVSACNVELCVAPTVRMICTAGVSNFINFLKGEQWYKIINIDAFNLEKGIDVI